MQLSYRQGVALFILEPTSEPSTQTRKRFSVIIQKEKIVSTPRFLSVFLLPRPPRLSVPSTVLDIRNARSVKLN